MLKYSLKFDQKKYDIDFVDKIIKRSKGMDIDGTIVYENNVAYLKDNYIGKTDDIKRILKEAESIVLKPTGKLETFPDYMRPLLAIRINEEGQKIATGIRFGFSEMYQTANILRFRNAFITRYRNHCAKIIKQYQDNTIKATIVLDLEKKLKLVNEISKITNDTINDFRNRIKLANITPYDEKYNDTLDTSSAIANEVTVFERNQVHSCISKKHKLEDLYIAFMVSTEKGIMAVKAFGSYCHNCKKYFITSSELSKVQCRGVILCKFLKHNGTPYTGNNILNFDGFGESVLHSMGYNVDATKKLSQIQRWKILEQAINNCILSGTEIINHLNMLISQRAGRYEMLDAINKWKTDIEHVASYKQTHPKVIATIVVEKDKP